MVAGEGVDPLHFDAVVREVGEEWGGDFGYGVVSVLVSGGEGEGGEVPVEGVSPVLVRCEGGAWERLLAESELDSERTVISIRPDGHVDKIFVCGGG